MRFTAYSESGEIISSEVYYSIGGGFICTEDQFDKTTNELKEIPFPFSTAEELISLCKKNNLSIAELMLQNELTWRDEQSILSRNLRYCQGDG